MNRWIYARLLTVAIAVTQTLSYAASTGEAEYPDKMDFATARKYLLNLINRDRTANGLKPLGMDEFANTAAQEHAEEMVVEGYLGHYDIQGRKPWERYNLAGGTGYVAENTFFLRSGYSADPGGTKYKLSTEPMFEKARLDRAEDTFINETPPHDGHRKNILDTKHDAVGIGVALSEGDNGIRMSVTHEFTQNKGTFAQLPPILDLTHPVVVAGRLAPGVKLHSVLLSWDRLPSPMSPEEISKLPSYSLPEKKIAIYWPPPYNSSIPIAVQERDGGMDYRLEIPPEKTWASGIYYIEIWVKDPRQKDPFPASLQTMRLTKSR